MGKSLSIDEMKRILKKEVEKSKKHSSFFSYVGVDRSKERTKQEGLERLQREEIELKGRKKTDFDDEVEKLLKDEGITDINRKDDYFRVFRENYIKIENLKIKWKRELIKGETNSQFDFVSQILNGETNHIISDVQSYTEKKPTKEPKSKSIREVVDEFLEFRKGTIGEKLLGEYKVLTDEFIEIIGNISVNSLSKDSIRKYIKTQLKLPINRRKTPKYRDLSINEVVDMNLSQKETQTPQNINKRLSKLTVFGNWGVRQGLLINNPFSGMKFSVKKQPNKREPFTKEELRKILKPETYHSWSINFTHPFRKERVSNQMPYYWVFLLGIFSGMRTNEMCQIRVIDIKKVDKIWFMFVEDSEETKVKTENAIRKVPVHPQLIELGFIDYVGTLKKQKKGRVFWELTEDRDGFASHLSRHYNQRVLPNLGVWKKYTKVLYCTRHTFINKLYTERVDENVIKVLVGHEKGFTMKQYGGEPFTPERLLEEISKVNYSGINWKKLKI